MIIFLIIPFFITPNPFFISEKQTWAYRGCGEKNNYNPENLAKAVNEGYQGVEIDVVYKDKQIWVQHDDISVRYPITLNEFLVKA